MGKNWRYFLMTFVSVLQKTSQLYVNSKSSRHVTNALWTCMHVFINCIIQTYSTWHILIQEFCTLEMHNIIQYHNMYHHTQCVYYIYVLSILFCTYEEMWSSCHESIKKRQVHCTIKGLLSHTKHVRHFHCTKMTKKCLTMTAHHVLQMRKTQQVGTRSVLFTNLVVW